MSTTAGDDRPRSSSDLSPLTLGLASLGSVVATVLLSRSGLAGTLVGAALTPVVISMVRELGKRPVERVVRLPSGGRAIVERRPRVSPRVIAITAGLAFTIAVALFTIPELIAGSSAVSDRPTTFFSPGDGSPAGGTTAPAETDGGGTTVAPPAETEAPPAETTTAPAATAPAPETAAPAPEAPPATEGGEVPAPPPSESAQPRG